MKKIVILILFTISYGCKKPAYDNVEMTCEFSFVDDKGKDIFSPDSSYQLNVNDFSITPFYDDHGGYIHTIYEGKNIFAINIYPDKEQTDTHYTRTLIKFGNVNVDTIRVEIAKTTHLMFIKRLWYNGKELQIHNNTSSTQCIPQVINFKPDSN
jgi:hypothetical protein